MIHLHKNWSRKEIESNFTKTCFYRQKSDFHSFFSLFSHFSFFLDMKWCSILFFVCALLVVGTVKIKFGNIVLITLLTGWLASYMIQGLFLELILFFYSQNKEWESRIKVWYLGITAVACFTFVSCTTNDYSMSVDISYSINSLHKYTV